MRRKRKKKKKKTHQRNNLSIFSSHKQSIKDNYFFMLVQRFLCEKNVDNRNLKTEFDDLQETF